MNPQELYSYLTNLLRSDPEVIASFCMGVFFSGVIGFAILHWLLPSRNSDPALARKDAEIARKESEIARKDAQIARLEARVATLEIPHIHSDDLQKHLLQDHPIRLVNPPLLESVMQDSHCAELEKVNRQLEADKKSLEHKVMKLETELQGIRIELQHTRKWLNVHEDENARLTDAGSLAEG